MDAIQVIDALLDVLDATGTVVGLMVLWYTWVVPPRTAPEPIALDLEHFLEAAAAPVPARSDQPQQEAGDFREASGWATGSTADRA